MSSKKGRKRRIGRPSKHGARALVYRDAIIREHPELVRYTRDCYDGLLADLAPEGPDTLGTAKRIVLSQVIEGLQIKGLLSIYLGEHPRAPLPELAPVITLWLQTSAAVLKNLSALGLEPVELEPKILTPQELLAQAAEEDAAREAAARAEAGQGEGDDAGKDAGGPEIALPARSCEAEGQESGQAAGEDEGRP